MSDGRADSSSDGAGGRADAGARKVSNSLFKRSSCFSVKPLAMSSDIELATLMRTSGLAKGSSYCRC